MRVNQFIVPLVVISILLGAVGLAAAGGQWVTTGRETVNLAKMTPAEIKGWMTLQQLMDGFGLSKETLYQIAGIPADVSVSTALKEIEKLVPGFETSILRTALTDYFAAQ
jgi:hypothetical protein